MKDELSDGGWLGGRVGVRDGVSERSNAGMLRMLDNPISPVIEHTQNRSGDGSALIKASTSLLRAFKQTNTRGQNRSRPIFHSERICDQPEMRGHAKWVRKLRKTHQIAAPSAPLALNALF